MRISKFLTNAQGTCEQSADELHTKARTVEARTSLISFFKGFLFERITLAFLDFYKQAIALRIPCHRENE